MNTAQIEESMLATHVPPQAAFLNKLVSSPSSELCWMVVSPGLKLIVVSLVSAKLFRDMQRSVTVWRLTGDTTFDIVYETPEAPPEPITSLDLIWGVPSARPAFLGPRSPVLVCITSDHVLADSLLVFTDVTRGVPLLYLNLSNCFTQIVAASSAVVLCDFTNVYAMGLTGFHFRTSESNAPVLVLASAQMGVRRPLALDVDVPVLDSSYVTFYTIPNLWKDAGMSSPSLHHAFHSQDGTLAVHITHIDDHGELLRHDFLHVTESAATVTNVVTIKCTHSCIDSFARENHRAARLMDGGLVMFFERLTDGVFCAGVADPMPANSLIYMGLTKYGHGGPSVRVMPSYEKSRERFCPVLAMDLIPDTGIVVLQQMLDPRAQYPYDYFRLYLQQPLDFYKMAHMSVMRTVWMTAVYLSF